MEIHFNNTYLERLYVGARLTGKPRYSREVIEKFQKRVVLLEALDSTKELKNFASLNFEALKGDKKGLYSIRIDRKYRLEFSIDKNNLTLHEMIFVEDLSNHYQ